MSMTQFSAANKTRTKENANVVANLLMRYKYRLEVTNSSGKFINADIIQKLRTFQSYNHIFAGILITS